MRTLSCGLLLAFSGVLSGQSLKLVKDGKSSFSICVSPEASPSERRGADELQRFLFEMSGAKLPQDCSGTGLILVGRSRFTDRLNVQTGQLGDEGFVLKTDGPNLIIAGGRKRGTMYAVYTFLEKLGCRWFTRDVSRIPKLSTIEVQPLNETIRPAFEYRETFFREAFDRDWAARNRMNGASMALDASTGGKITYYPFVHSFYRMIPPEKYFKEHPEYFSLINGKRRHERAQLCLTNPDLVRISTAQVLRWIDEHPDASIFSVSQNDWEGWCECENCRRVEKEEGGVHSGPLIRFVNAIAAEVEKKHPHKLIDTLAYWYTEEAPSRVRPRSNVRIRLCPIGACQAHPYEQCPRNGYFMKTLRDWSNLTKHLYIWHYNTDFAHYLLPFPDFDELAADIPMYRRHGVVGLFMQGDYSKGGGGENAELRSYVMAKLLWDTRADADRAIDEFLGAVDGRASGPMRAYLDLLHDRVRGGPHLYILTNPGAACFGGDFLSRALKLFAEAEVLAGSEEIRNRVRKARLSIDYLGLIRSTGFTFRDGGYGPNDAPGLIQRFAELIRTAKEFGITNLAESRTIDQDAEAFPKRMRTYRSVRLENPRWLLDVVPELGGRLVRMVHKASGRNALWEPDAGQPDYPKQGGETLVVGTDYHTVNPIKLKWKVDSVSEKGIILRGTGDRGIEIDRRIGFTENGESVRTFSTARNNGPACVELALLTRLEIMTGSLENTQFLEPGKPSIGRADYLGSDVPSGEWRFEKPGLLWTVRYPPVLLDRISVHWADRETQGIRLEMWSKRRAICPGETLQTEAEYRMDLTFSAK